MNRTASVIEQPSQTETEESRQFKAFRARVEANLHVPPFRGEVLQHYIQRPDLIPNALIRGFNDLVSNGDFEVARGHMDNFIEQFALPGGFGNDIRAKRLIRWIFAQSKGLVEEVVLFSPFDPDERTVDDEWVGKCTRELVESMCQANYSLIYYYMRGLGIPLILTSGISDGVFRFYLTLEEYRRGNARRLSWAEAMKAIAPTKQAVETIL